MRDQPTMPALFLGHGNPINAIKNNYYTRGWQKLAQSLPTPQAILMISAHWYTRGTMITAMRQPPTIHDFAGFPQWLFDIQYPAPGSPELAEYIQKFLAPTPVTLDEKDWGLDHGTWSLLMNMYPQAEIPVLQLSIDAAQSSDYHYRLGKRLADLRKEGILIIGSGNVVHNLDMIKWQREPSPYPWASSFEDFIRQNLTYKGDDEHPLINYHQHADAELAVPHRDHYLPLLYVLGSWDGEEPLTTPINGIEMGSLSMLSIQVG